MTLLSPLAANGNPDAQYRLAVMFQNGLGHVKNAAEAYKWMRAAAEQGHALAQHGLGFMHLQGECAGKMKPRPPSGFAWPPNKAWPARR